MSTIIAFLIGNKVGRGIAIGLLFVAIVGLVLWRVFAKGKQSAQVEEKIKQLQTVQEVIRTKVETDNEIQSLPVAERRERLNRWVRDDAAAPPAFSE